jgi:uncharacterized membrane protein YkvA (DUF1232 family)
MSTAAERIKPWVESFPADVESMKKALDTTGSDEARQVVAGALNYLITRMDLIPDWEETAGILDDAMVLRVAAAMATEKGLDASPEVGRLANEADAVSELLGAELYPRFKKHVEGLAGQAVRGRHPKAIVEDAKVRATLFTEIGDEIKRIPAAPVSDVDAVARTVKNYLSQKLGGK